MPPPPFWARILPFTSQKLPRRVFNLQLNSAPPAPPAFAADPPRWNPPPACWPRLALLPWGAD